MTKLEELLKKRLELQKCVSKGPDWEESMKYLNGKIADIVMSDNKDEEQENDLKYDLFYNCLHVQFERIHENEKVIESNHKSFNESLRQVEERLDKKIAEVRMNVHKNTHDITYLEKGGNCNESGEEEITDYEKDIRAIWKELNGIMLRQSKFDKDLGNLLYVRGEMDQLRRGVDTTLKGFRIEMDCVTKPEIKGEVTKEDLNKLNDTLTESLRHGDKYIWEKLNVLITDISFLKGKTDGQQEKIKELHGFMKGQIIINEYTKPSPNPSLARCITCGNMSQIISK
jgi:hypothetical protein